MPRRDAFVVDVDDMLPDITGGAFRSAPHRVINRGGMGSTSIPFVDDPSFDARFDTLPDVTAGKYHRRTFDSFYAFRKDRPALIG